jgi:hypothetical protein
MIGYKLAAWNARKLKLMDQSDDFYFSLFFLLLAGLFNRFLQNSLSSYEGTLSLSLIGGLQEIILRFTFKYRGRWIQKHIIRSTGNQLDTSEADLNRQDAVARLILMEMMVEYICIIVAPALIVFNQKNSVHFQFGYNIDGTYDSNLLFFSTAAALVVEIVVDVICFKYQEKHFRMKEAWVSLTGGSKLWLKLFPMFTIVTLMTTLILLAGFHKSLLEFAPDKCKFVNECMPYPCSQCYNGKNNSTASILPPMLQEICFRLSNSTSAVYEETRKWSIYTNDP